MNKDLEILAKEKGFNSLTALAHKMGKKPATFFNNLKYFTVHPNFTSKFALGLAEALGITNDELRKLFSNKSPVDKSNKLVQVLRDIHEQSQLRNKNIYNSFLNIFDTLQDGDQVCRCVTNRPVEFDDVMLQEKIFDAILRDVRFLYVHPRKNVHHENPPDFIRELFSFHRSLIAILESKITDKRELRFASSKIKNVFCTKGDSNLFNPFHSYIIIKKAGESDIYYILEQSMIGDPDIPAHSISSTWNVVHFIEAQKIGRQIFRDIVSPFYTMIDDGVKHLIRLESKKKIKENSDESPHMMPVKTNEN